MKKLLNLSLLLTFAITVMAPLTGVRIHKIVSALFLLLCVVHSVVYRKKFGSKYLWLIFLIAVSFASGLAGMIFSTPLVTALHRCVSVAVVFFLAIHLFLVRKRIV